MKKLCIFTLLIGLLMSVSVQAAGINVLFEDDFEEVTVTDGKAYINSKDEYALTTTNQGISKAEILTANGSKVIKFTGRTDTGSGDFVITLPQAYTEAAYPNTKLVIMFDEIIETAVSNSYAHMVIRGTNEGTAGNAVQMFRFAPSADKFVTFRANNSGASYEAKENQPMTHTYVIDLANDKFDWYYDTNKQTGLNFQNSGVLDAVTDIKFSYLAKEVVSLDNIKILAVPNDLVFEALGAEMDSVSDVLRDSDFSFNVSNYLSTEGISKITVTENDTTMNKTAYTIRQSKVAGENSDYIKVDVDFADKLRYGATYKISVPADVTDIAGNVISQPAEYSFSTEEKPVVNISNFKCYEGFVDETQEITTLADAKGKYVTLKFAMENNFTEAKSGVAIIAAEDIEGNKIGKGYMYADFIAGQDTMTYCMFVPENTAKIKAYIAADLAETDDMSAVLTLE